MFLLFVIFPIVEIYLLIHIGGIIGAANTFFFIIASGVLGYGLIRAQGAYLARNFQTQIAQNKVPAQAMFKSVINFFAGVLLFVPGYISSMLGVLLILPGTRQLLMLVLKKKIAEKIANGTFAFAGFGANGPFANSPFGADPRTQMRDVNPLEIHGTSDSIDDAAREVIDVTPKKRD